jgi:hypothetical protein
MKNLLGNTIIIFSTVIIFTMASLAIALDNHPVHKQIDTCECMCVSNSSDGGAARFDYISIQKRQCNDTDEGGNCKLNNKEKGTKTNCESSTGPASNSNSGRSPTRPTAPDGRVVR